MKKILLISMIVVLYQSAVGQHNIVLGQYFQNLPAFSPAMTGANDFLDLRLGFRKQWAGFENSPTTSFISAYGTLNQNHSSFKTNSLRTSSTRGFHRRGRPENAHLKMAMGGYILTDQQGPFSRTNGALNFAIHVPVNKTTYLSLGASGGISSSKIDLNDITVTDNINDQTYLSYIDQGAQSTSANLSSGFGIHSASYYLSYATLQLAQTTIGGNEDLQGQNKNLVHHVIGGYRFFLDNNWELIMSNFIRLSSQQPGFFELGARMRYDQNLWGGLSYRNDATFIAMFGLTINELANFSYSFEYKNTDINDFNSGSHEITLGLKLFNHSKYTPIW